jgi:hypothetical protein
MKRLKKGPELKMPELKVPTFVSDLFYDLHDRRLLAPIVLAVVAIAAVPFLLGGGSETPPAKTPGGIATPSPTQGAAQAASLTVVQAKPGLRDYRKRLAGRKPTDPFEQRYTAPSASGAELGSSSSSGSIAGTVTTSSASEGSSTGTTVTSAPPSGSSGAGGGNDGGKSPLRPGSKLFGFRPDVRFGVAGSNELTMHEELKLGSFLPQHEPIVIFIGVTQNGTHALFDVSPEVWSVRGDSNCVGGDENCHILSLREGEAVTLTTENERAFRLAVARIRFVEIDVPSKASSSASRPVASGLAQNFSN